MNAARTGFYSAGALARLAALVVLVALTSFAGLALAEDRAGVAPIWYANGILLGVLLRTPTPRWWPVVLAGALGMLVARLLMGQAPAFAVGLVLASVVELLLGAGGIRRVAGTDLDPEKLMLHTRSGVLAAVLSPLASGLLAALAFVLVQARLPVEEFATWYAAHALGIIIVTPLVLVAQRRVVARMFSRARLRTTLLALGLLVAVSTGVFLAHRAPLLFAIFPPLLYVVFQLGFAGAAIGVVLVSVAGVIATVSGHGPFAIAELPSAGHVLALQFFVAIASLTAFPIAVALAERRALRRILQESERRYRTLADHSSDIIVRASPDGTRLYVSPSVTEMLGWTPEELLGEEQQDIVHADNRAAFDEELAAMKAGAATSHLTYRCRHKQGHYVWVESLTRRVPGTDGASDGIVRVIRDISRRKQAEQALQDSERALRAVSDSLPALVARVDRSERFTFTNAYFRKALGMEPAALLGKTLRESLDPSLYAGMRAPVAQALAGDPVRFEGEHSEHGVPLYYQASFVPDLAASGEVTGFYAMVMDITARKWAELQQAEGEARLRTITDNLPVLIAFVDANGIVRFCNATHEAWLGKSAAQLIDRPLREVLGEAAYAAQLDSFRAALAGERVDFDLDLAGPEGERNTHALYIPHRHPDGRVDGIYALTLDMTSIRRVEQELHRLARFDALTALPNRRQFDEFLPQAIARARASGQALALMFIDVDYFKAINDTLGHAGGDEVLREFAWRLHDGVADEDFVARLAGDEFVIVMEAVADADAAMAQAIALVQAVREPFDLVSGPRAVSTSIGVAVVQGGALSPAEFMQLADQALYDAKAAGRDTARLAVDASVAEARARNRPAAGAP